jgi:hypothetical protein
VIEFDEVSETGFFLSSLLGINDILPVPVGETTNKVNEAEWQRSGAVDVAYRPQLLGDLKIGCRPVLFRPNEPFDRITIHPRSGADDNGIDLLLNEFERELARLSQTHPEKQPATHPHEKDQKGLEFSAKGHNRRRGFVKAPDSPVNCKLGNEILYRNLGFHDGK